MVHIMVWAVRSRKHPMFSRDMATEGLVPSVRPHSSLKKTFPSSKGEKGNNELSTEHD